MRSVQRAHSDRAKAGRVELRSGPAFVITLTGAAMVLAGLTFGASTMYVPGVGFLLLGLAAGTWVSLAARGAQVTRRLGTTRMAEEEPFEAVLEVRRGRLGAPDATIHDPLVGAPIPVGGPLSILWGHATLELRVITRIERRGRYEFAQPSLGLSDPFGLARAGRPGRAAPDVVVVLPRTEPVRWIGREQGGAGHAALLGAAHEPAGAGEFDGLREYTPGTPASRIYWPGLARGAGLLERRLVGEQDGRPLIVIDPRAGDRDGAPERLDAAVRAAASLALELARAGGCRVLLPGSRTALAVGRDLVAWPAVHTRLALVELEPDLSRAPSLRTEAGHGAVVWVGGWGGARPELSGTSRRGPIVLVLPLGVAPRLSARASFRVSGCAGFVLRTAGASRRRAAA